MIKESWEDIKKKYLTFYCKVCFETPSEPCHIKSRGSGGPEEHWNLIALCRKCHRTQHDLGWWRFCQRHSHLLCELKYRGWEFVDIGSVKKLRRKD